MLDGYVHPDFSAVGVSLLRQLAENRRGGAAVCVYHHGERVVDIWGGARNEAGDAWRRDTTALSFSTTKGVLSTLLHVVLEEADIGYDTPVARWWPAFSAAGKEGITIRQAMAHEAGLYRIGEMIGSPAEMLDWPHMLDTLAAAAPVHRPGLMHGYHAFTYGWLIGGLIEAITETPLADTLAQKLAGPLALDGCFIGMPAEALHRRALLIDNVTRPFPKPSGWRGDVRKVFGGGLKRLGVDTDEFRQALAPFNEPFDFNAEDVVQAAIPAANGQFTARALARMYAMLAEGGELDGRRLLSPGRYAQIKQVQNRSRDKVLFLPMHWRLGYHRAFTIGVKASEAFGHYGYGGSGAFCDPSRHLAVAFIVNYGAGTPTGDTRMPRIARAAHRSVDRLVGRRRTR